MVERTVPSSSNEGGVSGSQPTRSEETAIAPPVDIYEDDRGLVVVADLPGVDPAAVDVHVEQGVLTIQGRATHLMQREPVHREYELTGFFRQFQLPEEVDTTRIEAQLRNGVLTVTLPRLERAQPRRIEVRSP
jgi:HSP20 family molecular chaperone IbpA